VSDFEADGLQEVRGQGAKSVSATRDRSIGRRDFLTRFFRNPGRAAAPPSEDGTACTGDPPRSREHRHGPRDAREIARSSDAARPERDFTAPDCAPERFAGKSHLDRVLQAMNDSTGIEDP